MTLGIRKLALVASALLFVTATALAAVVVERVCTNGVGLPEVAGLWGTPRGTLETLHGVAMLFGGALGVVFMRFGAFGWLANPFYFVALLVVLIGRPAWIVVARLVVVPALALALLSLPLTNWFPLPADEGGVCWQSAIRPAIGYWLWLAAIVAIAVGAFARTASPRTAPAGG